MAFKVAVIGAGINGISCALKIKEKHRGFDVVIISKDFSPNTTGDGSGGLWYPFLCGKTPEHLLTKWGCKTYDFLYEKWFSGGLDINLMPIYILYRKMTPHRQPMWAKNVFGYRELEEAELNFLGCIDSVKYQSGHTFNTFVVHPTTILSQFLKRFEELGGIVVSATIKSLRDSSLKEFDVVVNCTGLGAKELVSDGKMWPIRGQIARIIAPWVNATIIDEDGDNYIIPNSENCVLGGTHQEHNYDTNTNDEDTKFIFNGCREILPGLQGAEVITHWAGLRPGRDEVRLELQIENQKVYIHNYGHGGSGFTLFWGCATDVLGLLDDYLAARNKKCKNFEKSKL